MKSSSRKHGPILLMLLASVLLVILLISTSRNEEENSEVQICTLEPNRAQEKKPEAAGNDEAGKEDHTGKEAEPAGKPILGWVISAEDGMPVSALVEVFPDPMMDVSWTTYTPELLTNISTVDKPTSKTLSGPDGFFSIRAGIPEDALRPSIFTPDRSNSRQYCLRISAKGFATSFVHRVGARAGTSGGKCTVCLGKHNTIRGRVINAVFTPLEGALVIAVKSRLEIAFSAKWRTFDKHAANTDTQGEFRFDDVGGGTIALYVKAHGMAPVLKEVTVPCEREIEIVLHRGFTIRGKVLDGETRKPIEGARVLARMRRREKGYGMGTTDSSGAYRISDLTPGIYEVVAAVEGKVDSEKRCEGSPGGEVDLDFTLTEGLVVTGKILDASSGSPIEGVRVVAPSFFDREWMGFDRPEVVTGPDGAFTLENVSTTYTKTSWSTWEGRGKKTVHHCSISGVKRGWFQDESKRFTFPPDTRRLDGVEVPLCRTPKATGCIVDSRGKPIPGAHLMVIPGDEDYDDTGHPIYGETPEKVVSGPDGRFQIDLWPNRKIILLASHPGFAFGYREFEPLRPGHEVKDVEIMLTPGGVIRGKVLDEKGHPVRGERIITRYVGESELGKLPAFRENRALSLRGPEWTDHEGKFTLQRLKPGIWSVSLPWQIFDRRQDEWIKVSEGKESELCIQLSPSLTIVGTVLDESGNPVPWAHVYAESLRGSDFGNARSEQHGSFVIKDVFPGLYRVQCSCYGYDDAEISGISAGEKSAVIVMKKEDE